uniref:Beta-glucosidase n=1 Tax=Quercus lobata TaxID=97700 RepID=A0A7N2KL33_QUELO
MAFQGYPGLGLLVLLGLLTNVIAVSSSHDIASFNRTSFPKGFIFGTASSSYQKDVRIMKKMNLDAYRFSISWSRVLPKGKLSGGVNQEGIEYYNKLINRLLGKGIKPFVTMFHWDLPQALEDEYGGFLSPQIVDDFRDYAELLFKEFGDRVKHWITLNEPWSYSYGGYAAKALAPGRCSAWQNLNCTGGDSGTEPYLVSHHELLSHAAAVELYKKKYQAAQKGVIGITIVSHWFVPFSNAKRDQKAAERAVDFMLGWFLNPLINGDYPQSMRSLVKDRLPKFTKEQSKLAASSWLFVYPRGFRDLLLYIKKKYHNPLIYITENGIDEFNNATLSLKEALVDPQRIDYYHKHLLYLHRAIKDGVNVKGYFAWSLLDNFEWSSGYTVRFGINFVDYKNGNKRYPKHSARWFKNFLKNHDTASFNRTSFPKGFIFGTASASYQVQQKKMAKDQVYGTLTLMNIQRSVDLKFGRASQRSDGLILDLLLKFGCASQKSDGLILDVLPKGPLKLNLDVLPKGPLKLNFERASQRSDGLKFGRASQRSDELKFGCASQRSDGLKLDILPREVQWIEVWTCFLEVQGFEFWTCFPEIHGFEFGRASQRSMDLNLDVLPRVVSMAPKRKSTLARNPLRSGASSSFDFAPLFLWFRDDDAHKAFSENFSRCGIHSERQVILTDFADTDLPTVIHSRGWESLCDVLVTCPLMIIQEFYSNMHQIDPLVPLFFTCIRDSASCDKLIFPSAIARILHHFSIPLPAFDLFTFMCAIDYAIIKCNEAQFRSEQKDSAPSTRPTPSRFAHSTSAPTSSTSDVSLGDIMA